MQGHVAIETRTMSQDGSKISLPGFFDKNPELKRRVVAFLRSVPDAEKKDTVEAFRKFVSGDLTWAEVRHVPRRLLKELAKIGYFKFQSGDYKGAEILFKGLAIIDHNNWYYRSALGAVYQKQGLYEAAIDEYTVALQIKDDEATSLVNRGECLMRVGDLDSALEDFTAVTTIVIDPDSPWRKRAEILTRKILSGAE